MRSSGVFVIAEAGVNHNGSLELACRLVDAAAEAGADAVKFQTFKAERLVGRMAAKAAYQRAATDAQETQLEMLRRLELDEPAHRVLAERCAERGIAFLSTPFDADSLALLAGRLSLPRLKLPSGEITNAPLLLAAARTLKPIILSTGMCTLGDVEAALGVLAFGYMRPESTPSEAAFRAAYASASGRAALLERVVLLHCTTEYPAPFDEVNLRAMDTLAAAFGLRVGYSDHTEGVSVPIAAVARGAQVIEKHFTLDRTLPGPDHRASLEPAELAAMVTAIRQVERALGSAVKSPTPAEAGNMPVARKSLVALRPIRPGEPFTEANLGAKRPGTGVSPMRYYDMLGRVADRAYAPDEEVAP